MTTSATHNFTLDVADIIQEAYERIGDDARSGYDLRTARRSLDLLLLEWQNRGLNLWKVKTDTQTLTAGTAAYDLDPEQLDIIEAVIRTNAGTSNQTDYSIKRVSVSSWARQTNKLTTGRPTQYWLSRTASTVTVNLWPVPDSSTTYTLLYYFMEQIEDTGKPSSNTVDVPERHLPALISGLAYQLAIKNPSKAALLPVLKQEYLEQWELASDSVREKASWFLRPRVAR